MQIFTEVAGSTPLNVPVKTESYWSIYFSTNCGSTCLPTHVSIGRLSHMKYKQFLWTEETFSGRSNELGTRSVSQTSVSLGCERLSIVVGTNTASSKSPVVLRPLISRDYKKMFSLSLISSERENPGVNTLCYDQYHASRSVTTTATTNNNNNSINLIYMCAWQQPQNQSQQALNKNTM